MSLALTMVALAAVFHAGWNALFKSVGDKAATSALIALVSGLCGVALLVLAGPPPMSVWPFALASGVLQTAYLGLLYYAMDAGQLSQVFPVARSSCPIWVTLVAVGLLGERLTTAAWVGFGIVMAGTLALVVFRGLPATRGCMRLGLAAGALLAAFTLVDGTTVRRVGESTSYTGAALLAYGVVGFTYLWLRQGPGRLRRARATIVPGVMGGVLTALAAGLVIWAQLRAPLPLVSALRETTVVWSPVIGRLWFDDSLTRREWVAIAVALVGVGVVQAAMS